MDKEKLNKIDQCKDAINNGITPGAVVLVAKDNKIVKETAYGHSQLYDMRNKLQQPVKMTKRQFLIWPQ